MLPGDVPFPERSMWPRQRVTWGEGQTRSLRFPEAGVEGKTAPWLPRGFPPPKSTVPLNSTVLLFVAP